MEVWPADGGEVLRVPEHEYLLATVLVQVQYPIYPVRVGAEAGAEMRISKPKSCNSSAFRSSKGR